MYRITVEGAFSSAHRLPDHPHKCQNLHGHNWRVELTAGAESLNDAGMVMDFAELKGLLGKVCDRYDHRLLNEIPPFDTIPPTAEHLARTIYDEVGAGIGDPRVEILSVRIWETARNLAEYCPS